MASEESKLTLESDIPTLRNFEHTLTTSSSVIISSSFDSEQLVSLDDGERKIEGISIPQKYQDRPTILEYAMLSNALMLAFVFSTGIDTALELTITVINLIIIVI